MKQVFIRAEVVGVNPAGQKRIHVLANNADGMYFWTDDKSIIEPDDNVARTGHWIDHSEDGYAECPFCHSATNCDGNVDELHFCFSCGAKLKGGETE